jgi:hypothetical protein
VTGFFFWEKRPIRTILVKNLISHGERMLFLFFFFFRDVEINNLIFSGNKKTSVMYALSLGFIIFISVAASLQIQTIEYGF